MLASLVSLKNHIATHRPMPYYANYAEVDPKYYRSFDRSRVYHGVFGYEFDRRKFVISWMVLALGVVSIFALPTGCPFLAWLIPFFVAMTISVAGEYVVAKEANAYVEERYQDALKAQQEAQIKWTEERNTTLASIHSPASLLEAAKKYEIAGDYVPMFAAVLAKLEALEGGKKE